MYILRAWSFTVPLPVMVVPPVDRIKRFGRYRVLNLMRSGLGCDAVAFTPFRQLPWAGGGLPLSVELLLLLIGCGIYIPVAGFFRSVLPGLQSWSLTGRESAGRSFLFF